MSSLLVENQVVGKPDYSPRKKRLYANRWNPEEECLYEVWTHLGDRYVQPRTGVEGHLVRVEVVKCHIGMMFKQGTLRNLYTSTLAEYYVPTPEMAKDLWHLLANKWVLEQEIDDDVLKVLEVLAIV